MDKEAALDERFQKWSVFLREKRAAPLCVLALSDRNELIVTTCEGIDDDRIEEFLQTAIVLLRRERQAKRGKRR